MGPGDGHDRGRDALRRRAGPGQPLRAHLHPGAAERRSPPRRRWPRRARTSATASSGTASSAAPPMIWRPGRERWSATALKQRAVYRDDDGQAPRALGPLHPPRVHRALQRRRAQLGLPVPRLALRHRRRGARGARRASAAARPAERRPNPRLDSRPRPPGGVERRPHGPWRDDCTDWGTSRPTTSGSSSAPG